MSWDDIIKTMELYVEFTWVNIGIFYTGNVSSKYNAIKEANTSPSTPTPVDNQLEEELS